MTARRTDPVKLTDAGQVDLDSHAVIEASAGTGKTYTIERIVVRLLMSGRISSLDQALVVTFTEKATSEIRARIRALLKEEKSTAAPQEARRLGEALDSFDSASIFTIHGFCNRVLQLYPFEYGGHFSFSLADDGPVCEMALRERIRSSWRATYGDNLAALLGLSGFPDESMGRSRWISRVLKIAGSYCPEAGDALLPEPAADLAGALQSLPGRCAKTLEELSLIAGEIDPADPWASDIAVKYDSLNYNHKRKGRLIDRMLIPLARIIAGHRQGSADAFALIGFRSEIDPGENGFNDLVNSWNKSGPDYEKKFPGLPRLAALAAELVSLIPGGMDMQLAVNSVLGTLADASRYKRDRALVSYRDMIALVEAASRDADGGLCRELRKKYRYAVVDEFQDTDMLQWSLFRNVFLSGDSTRLIVVGDPKQAIYGFRGADVYAYHAAKREMIASGARFYSLAENWRSSKTLVGQFNILFGGGNWFTDPEVAYLDVAYPEKRSGSGAPADQRGLAVVDLGERAGTEARSQYARFAAREIARLLESPEFAPGDIAILIRKWSESPFIEEELGRLGVRFSYYKREGLYQSREALQVRCLLGAIAAPGDLPAVKKALLTPFFGLNPGDLPAYDAAAESHPATVLLSRWNAMAVSGRWAELFDSVLRDSGLAPRVLDRADGERSLADFRHIMEDISSRACAGRAEIRRLIKDLDALITGVERDGDASNFHRPEREDPGVQIMTVHASKGLQFPVVFVAGGFTGPKSDDVMVYHEQGRRCFNLGGTGIDRDAKERCALEQRWEEERLFYVATTRAARLLYVPFFRYRRNPGPLGKWIADALENCRAGGRLEWIDGTAMPAASARESAPQRRDMISRLSACAASLLECSSASYLDRRAGVESFTSIKNRKEGGRGGERSGFGHDNHREDDEAAEAAVPADDPLPGGAYMGTVFHEVLERVDFSEAAEGRGILEAAVRSLDRNLPAYMRRDGERFAPEIARIVRNTLSADISGDGLVLGRITKRVHEVEFHVPVSARTRGPREIAAGEGFVTGFIDMVFEHRGKYYLLDWKSNHLPGGYGPEELARCMDESSYVLQYRIYAAALLRYLGLRLDSFDYERHFGGIYYVFLRGVDPAKPGSGVFFYRPSGEAEIRGYEGDFSGE